MDARNITNAVVAAYFPPRRWAVCPNASWGIWGLAWEADIFAVSKSGCAHEIEIKVTASDLRADAKKRKWYYRGAQLEGCHHSFWYAVPAKLEELALQIATERGAGLFVVDCVDGVPSVRRPRCPKRRAGKHPRKDMRTCVWRLVSLRYWADRLAPRAKE